LTASSAQLDGSRTSFIKPTASAHIVGLTATVTATTAAATALTQPWTAKYSRSSDLSWASARPEKRTVGGPLLRWRLAPSPGSARYLQPLSARHGCPTLGAKRERPAVRTYGQMRSAEPRTMRWTAPIPAIKSLIRTFARSGTKRPQVQIRPPRPLKPQVMEFSVTCLP